MGFATMKHDEPPRLPLAPMEDLRVKPFLRYLLVGGVATLAHYAVLMATVELQLLPPAPAAGLGAWVGAQVAYAGNAWFTFDGARLGFASWWRFQVTAAIGMVLSFALVGAGVSAGVHYLVAQAVATVLAALVTYAVNRRWTFA
jgi:putative flippase GtrA